MDFSNLQKFFMYRFRYGIAYSIIAVVSLLALFFGLDSLLPGISQTEAASGLANSRFSDVLESGVYLPYNALQWLSLEILGPTALGLRLPSTIFALATLILLFALLHMWHRERIAISIVLFLATSSWYLNFARFGTPYIYLAFSVTLALFISSMIRHYSHNMVTLAFMAAGLMLALYAPFLVYLYILLGGLYYRQIVGILKDLRTSQLIALLLASGFALLPLVYGFVSHSDSLAYWLGWDGSVHSLRDYATNLSNMVGHIFWRSQELPEQHLGDIAMLDLFTATMIALGLYHYEQHHHYLRTRALIYGLGVLALALGLSSTSAHYILLSPILYVLAATGIITLLKQWYNIFPINPLARVLGIVPMLLAIIITGQYHMNRYFFAWASHPPVKQLYAPEPVLLADDVANQHHQAIIAVIPSSLLAQSLLLTRDNQTQVQFVTDIEMLDPIKPDTILYVHGSLPVPSHTLSNASQRVIETDRESLPIGFNVIET